MKKVCLDKSEYSIGKKIIKELYILFILQFLIFITTPISFTIELTLIVMYILLMSTKNKRIIYSIDFQNDNVEIKYFIFIFIKKVINIEKGNFNFSYKQKRLGFGGTSQIISLFNEKNHIGDINEASTWAWGKEKFNKIKAIISNYIK